MRVHWSAFGVALGFALLGANGPAVAEVPHRLESLSGEEISKAVEILKAEGKVGETTRFVQVALNEPPKDGAWDPTSRPPREALAILIDHPGGSTFEAIVDLEARKVRSWDRISRGKPPLLAEDYAATSRIIRADARFREAIARRGILDPEDVQVDAWAPGGPVAVEGRVSRALFFLKPDGQAGYLRPIGNLTALVDLDRGTMIELTDLGPVPIPASDAGFAVAKTRAVLAPLRVEQSRGVGFERSGEEIRWQGWRLRASIHPRDGLVLREVGIEEDGRVRPILYRGSLSELLVPYGDPAPDWSFRNAFDEGEYGIGRSADSLKPGVDCPENAVYADAVLADESGTPSMIPRAIGIFERDGGILWRHSARGRAEARRGRELVIHSSSTLGNYVYGFEWTFRQDGSIAVEVLLTGIMLVKAVDPARMGTEPSGHKVADGLIAVHHQHFFNYRLDLDVGGVAPNRVAELNVEAIAPGEENPQGNAFSMMEADLPRESNARRSMSLAASRRWKVYHPSIRNATGGPVGYRLVPGENALPMASATALVRGRAGFLDAHFWATRFAPLELHASGPYPNQNAEDEGLGARSQANRPLNDQDVVIWYTMGVTHAPRPEDWPVMPTHRAGFLLVPDGFFAKNPALDLPESNPEAATPASPAR